MNRVEFDRALRQGIRGLSKADVQRFSEYYAEMLDDRIEAGMTEAAAVAQLGDPREIAAQILSDGSLPEVQRLQDRLKRRPRAWVSALIVLGSPVWLAVALAAFSAALAVMAALWSVIVVLWAADLAFALCAPACVAMAVSCIVRGDAALSTAMLGAGLFCAGAAIVWFYFARWATVSLVHVFGKIKTKVKMKMERKI